MQLQFAEVDWRRRNKVQEKGINIAVEIEDILDEEAGEGRSQMKSERSTGSNRRWRYNVLSDREWSRTNFKLLLLAYLIHTCM